MPHRAARHSPTDAPRLRRDDAFSTQESCHGSGGKKPIESNASCRLRRTSPRRRASATRSRRFDAFVDGVVEEIGQLKATLKNGAPEGEAMSPGLGESVVPASATPDVASPAGENAERELERQAS
jgi:hypothetical protein